MFSKLLKITARTMIAPEIAVCAYGHTERIFIALLIIPNSNTPMNAPPMVPFPPSKVTPPIIAAVRAFSSYPVPAVAVIESSLETNTMEAIALMTPLIE